MRLHRYVLIPVLALLILAPTATPANGQEPWEPTPAGWRSGPIIEHVGQLAVEAGGALGAVRLGRYLYVSSARSFSIYDIRQPATPQRLSTTPVPYAISEHPDTNGKILLLSLDLGGVARMLEVWDVRNKSAPVRLGGLFGGALGGGDHTWTCVLDCTFAYGSQGSIVDLANPAAPARVGDWRPPVVPGEPARRFHGIDQVAPGIVLTAGEPTFLLDARTNPAAPTVVATAAPPVSTAGLARRSIPSYAHWPLDTAERFALETIETPFSGPCTEGSGGLVTFDTAGYQTTGTFAVADEHRFTTNGTFTDGNPPANAVGCSAFGLDESPDWADDRLVAVAAMEHGVRLLHVDTDGQITEVGGFIGHGTEAAHPVWGAKRILYVADLTRGVDVFKVREPAG